MRWCKYLELSVSPSRNFNNHIENGLLGVGIEGDIVEGGDGDAILLKVDTVLQGVGSSHLADGVRGGHFCLIEDRRMEVWVEQGGR